MKCRVVVCCLVAGSVPAVPAMAANAPTTATTAAATPVDLEFSSGFDYSTGRYGLSSDTRVLDVPFGVKFQDGNLRLEASIPYLDITGPGISAGDVVVTGPNSKISERSGVGDLVATGGWTLFAENGPIPGVELAGTVKLPTAGSGLGTGKTDFTAQANLFHSLTPTTLLFGSLGYQWLGSPAGFTLLSGVRVTAGVNFKPQDNVAFGVLLDYREKYESALSDYVSLDPYAVWRFLPDLGISAYGIIGATNSAPGFGGGFRLIAYL